MATATASATERRGEWIQVGVGTGQRFYPLDPRPEEVEIEDIAHALSHLCRFTGHTRELYSVCQHSVLVSRQCSPRAALWGLLHDAAEAYIGDLSRPLKRSLRAEFGDAFDRIEDGIAAAVRSRFAVPFDAGIAAEVKKWDTVLCVTEARDLMAPLHPDWKHTPENGFDVLAERIVPWSPPLARRRFLDRFRRLMTAAV